MLNQTLSVTNRCSLACTYCWYETGAQTYPASTVGAEDYERWFEECARQEPLGVAYLTGGEPTLRADFADVLDVAHGWFREVVLMSNGISLGRDRELVQRLAASGTLLHVSLDHVSPGLDDRVRGGTKATLAGLAAAREAGVRVQVAMVMTARNARDVAAVVEHCRENGFGLELIAVAVPEMHPLSVRQLPPEDRVRLVGAIRAAADVLGRPEYYLRLREYLERGRVRPLSRCRVVEEGFFVESDGAVFLCGHRRELLGRIQEASPSAVAEARAAVLDRRAAGPCVTLDCLMSA